MADLDYFNDPEEVKSDGPEPVIDTTRLTEDQQRALAMSRKQSAFDRFEDRLSSTGREIGKIGDKASSFLHESNSQLYHDAKSAALKYGPSAALNVGTALAPDTVGAARAAYDIRKAAGLDKGLPPGPPAAGDWGSVAAPGQPTQPGGPPPGPPPQQGQPVAAGRGGGGGAPVDWNAQARAALGGNVSDAPVGAAQGAIDANAMQGADVEGAVARNRAANSELAGQRNDAIDLSDQQNQAAIRGHQDRLMNRASALEEDAMNSKIDPERYWHNQSTGGKIMSTLAVAFGAIGQSFGHTGTNVGLEAVNKHIDQDIESQREAIKSKKEGAQAMRGMYSELRQRGLDDSAAAAKTKQINLDKAARDSQIFADQSQDPQVKLKAQQAALQFQKQAAEQKVDFEKHVASQAYAMHHAALAASASAAAAADKQRYERGMAERKMRLEELKTASDIEGKGSDDMGKAESQIAKDRLEKGIVPAEQAMRELKAEQAANGGKIAGTGLLDRMLNRAAAPDEEGHTGVLGMIASGVRGQNARHVDSILERVAEAQARATGRASPALIARNKRALMGNGSNEDISRNLASAMQTLNAEKRTQAGANPAAYEDYVSKNPDARIDEEDGEPDEEKRAKR